MPKGTKAKISFSTVTLKSPLTLFLADFSVWVLVQAQRLWAQRLWAVSRVLHTEIAPLRLSAHIKWGADHRLELSSNNWNLSDTAWPSHFKRNLVRFILTASKSSSVYLSGVSAGQRGITPLGPGLLFLPKREQTSELIPSQCLLPLNVLLL